VVAAAVVGAVVATAALVGAEVAAAVVGAVVAAAGPVVGVAAEGPQALSSKVNAANRLRTNSHLLFIRTPPQKTTDKLNPFYFGQNHIRCGCSGGQSPGIPIEENGCKAWPPGKRKE
jgi:hypothetical protein